MRGLRQHPNLLVRFVGRVLYAVLSLAGFLIGLGCLIWLADTFAGTGIIDNLVKLWDHVTSGGFKQTVMKTLGMVIGGIFGMWFLMELIFPSQPSSYRGKVYVDRNGDGRIDERDGYQ